MNCIDLTSKRSKMLSYVAKHSKQRKTTKVIKIQWLASIWRQNKQKLWVTSQNIQNYANLRKWSNYNELHRFDVKTIYNALWVTSQNIQNYAKLRKSSNYNQLHRFDVNTIYNDQLRRKTFKITQNYESDQIIMNCIDLTSNDLKCWVTSQPFKTAKLQKWSTYTELHRFDVKWSKMQNYESDQIIMNCIALTWNDLKCWVTRKTF